MKWFFDTSVLMPVFMEDHVHHDRSFAAFEGANRKLAGCAAHSLAEIYAGVTRLPGKNRMGIDQALIVLETVVARLTVVSLESAGYLLAIRDAAKNGIVGGTIYDALIAACAIKARAETIYTWDDRHFRLFGPEISRRVANP